MKATDLNQAFHYVEDAYLAEVDAPDKENHCMKNKKRIRYFVLAAALICLLSITVYAVEQLNIHSYLTGSSKYYEQYSDLNRAFAQAGFQATLPESFANGFQFEKAKVQNVEAMDENNHLVMTLQEIVVFYKNQQGQYLDLRASLDMEGLPRDDRPPTSTKTLGDVELSYYRDLYRFVPEDYQPSEEEQEWASQPGHYISYGADEVQERIATFLCWTENGIRYSILDWNTVEPEAMFAMAEEMIR